MIPKPKQIGFDEEMSKDLQEIKETFKNKFGIVPSNRHVMNLLLQTYKEANPNIRRKPKSRKGFLIHL